MTTKTSGAQRYKVYISLDSRPIILIGLESRLGIYIQGGRLYVYKYIMYSYAYVYSLYSPAGCHQGPNEACKGIHSVCNDSQPCNYYQAENYQYNIFWSVKLQDVLKSKFDLSYIHDYTKNKCYSGQKHSQRNSLEFSLRL